MSLATLWVRCGARRKMHTGFRDGLASRFWPLLGWTLGLPRHLLPREARTMPRWTDLVFSGILDMTDLPGTGRQRMLR